MLHDPTQLERVNELIARQNVRFINLQFSDIVGIVKQITIPVSQWTTAVDHGIWFDGSSIEGFARIAESDMYLVPDLATFAVLPWEMTVLDPPELREVMREQAERLLRAANADSA